MVYKEYKIINDSTNNTISVSIKFDITDIILDLVNENNDNLFENKAQIVSDVFKQSKQFIKFFNYYDLNNPSNIIDNTISLPHFELIKGQRKVRFKRSCYNYKNQTNRYLYYNIVFSKIERTSLIIKFLKEFNITVDKKVIKSILDVVQNKTQELLVFNN